MKLRIIHADEHNTSAWAGGTTSELAIWPENGCYASRKFAWRISAAKCGLDESDFTDLPGFHRILMVLEGSITLTHDGGREISLSAFDIDEFDGASKTHCAGRCSDFNLMLAEGWHGHMRALKDVHKANEALSHTFDAFYCVSGNVIADVKPSHEEIDIAPGDLLLIERAEHGLHLRLNGADGGKFSGVRISISEGEAEEEHGRHHK